MNHLHFYIFAGLLLLFVLSVAIYKYIYYIPFYTPRTLKYNIEGKDIPILDLTLNNVPAVIYQSCESRSSIKNPSVILNNYNNNSEFDFYMYDVDDQRKYIKNNFNDIILKTFDNLTYNKKTELWKYCILYKKGGIYLDTKYNIKKPLVEYISSHPIIFIDNASFISVPPNLDIFKLMIDSYVNKLPTSFNNLMNDFNYSEYITLHVDNNRCIDKYSDNVILEFSQ